MARGQQNAEARRKVIRLAVQRVSGKRSPRYSDDPSSEDQTRGYLESSADYDGQTVGQYWHSQIDSAGKVFEKWDKRADKIIKRYRDERDAIEQQRKRFNILWSNIQVLIPSLYGRPASPQVSRRYKDSDPVGRVASEILERCLTYETEEFEDFDAAMRGAVQDRLLPGRGTVWLRYDPEIESQEPAANPEEEVASEGAQITSNAEDEATKAERIVSERSPVDYVYWKDFLHSPARTWAEVWWVARRVYLSKDEGEERFGDVFSQVPLETPQQKTEDKEGARESLKQKAVVWEIWNKNTGKVCWIAKGYQEALDERDDPLGLDEFFPCPAPLYATTTTGSLVPIPDFCEYQDQADEIDNLTERINRLTKALKAVGVYNAEYKSLQRLLVEGLDNILFPVDQWAAFAEKGGMKGAIELLDVSSIAAIITELYNAREQSKQGIYEIFGLSDIMRGASKATETLGAQQLKANFGSLRLRSSQIDVARFASCIFRMKAQIITKFYQPQTMLQMSGIELTDDGEQAQLVQEAIALLKNTPIRNFRIEVEADILAQIDEQQEKDDRVQLTQMLGVALEKSLPVVQAAPEIAPLVLEAISFAVRGFRVGRSMESAIDKATAAIQQATSQPKPPSPEIMAQQAQQQNEQQRLAFDQQKHNDEMAIRAQELQIAAAKAQPQPQQSVDPRMADAELADKLAHVDLQIAQADLAKNQAGIASRTADAAVAKTQAETQSIITPITDTAQGINDVREQLGQVVDAIRSILDSADGQTIVQAQRMRGPDGSLIGMRRMHKNGTVSEIPIQ